MKTKICLTNILIVFFFFIYKETNAQAPGWLWAHSFGELVDEAGQSIAVDASGNVYTTGYFSGIVDFDPGPGIFNLTATGFTDIFISKLNSSGNFVWAKSLTGSISGSGQSIAIDASGNVYTTGYFRGMYDFDPGTGVYNITSADYDVFISKLDNAGNFVWAKTMGGIYPEVGFSMAIDALQNIYTAGYFYDIADFDPDTTAIFNLTSAGARDVFISKLDSAGNFKWAKSFGGTDNDWVSSVNLSPSGNGVYSTGRFEDTVDFDPGPAIFNLTSAGNIDIFISKLDSAGNFAWAKTIGGPYSDAGLSIAVDASENVYTTGYFAGTVDFDPGSPGVFNLSSAGGSGDIFISKLDSSGNFTWAKAMGGPDTEFSFSLAIDSVGNIYSTGGFFGTADFNPDSLAIFNITSAGDEDIFVSKSDSSGNFIWAKSMGGTSAENGLSLAWDHTGAIYMTGSFRSPFIPFDNITLTNMDSSSNFLDGLVAKLGNCSAHFTLYADTIPHNWIAVNQAYGAAPLTYLWNWGDSTTSSGATPSHIYNTPGYYNICLSISDASGCTSNYCDSSTYLYRGNAGNAVVTINVVLPNSTTVSEQSAEKNNVIIYPNPASDHLIISLPGNIQSAEVIVSDIAGNNIYSIRETKKQKIEINTREFTGGIYILQIKTPGFIETKKIIIAR